MWSTPRVKSTTWHHWFILFAATRSFLLARIEWTIGICKPKKILCVSFSRRNFVLCAYTISPQCQKLVACTITRGSSSHPLMYILLFFQCKFATFTDYIVYRLIFFPRSFTVLLDLNYPSLNIFGSAKVVLGLYLKWISFCFT